MEDNLQEAGSLKTARYKHTAATLADGRVLIAGGSDERDGAGTLATAEIYDPKERQVFRRSSDGPWRYKLPEQAAIFGGRKVLVAGGNASAEIYDAAKNIFELVDGETGSPQWYLSETLLPNGDVLLAGGYSTTFQATSQVWVFHQK